VRIPVGMISNSKTHTGRVQHREQNGNSIISLSWRLG
jgi:hypothetical protein